MDRALHHPQQQTMDSKQAFGIIALENFRQPSPKPFADVIVFVFINGLVYSTLTMAMDNNGCHYNFVTGYDCGKLATGA
jgi:hypothetical protein